MALEYFKWSGCKLIRRTSSSTWTVLDAGPYTVLAAAYDDPTWADAYNNKNLGTWGYDNVTQQWTWIPNDLGKALLRTLGSKTTMFRVRRNGSSATNPNNTMLMNTLRNYINVIDVYSKGEGSSSAIDPCMEYHNNWGDMCHWVAASAGFIMYIPIYRSDGYLYTCIYLADSGVAPNRYVSSTVARYLMSSALSASGLTPLNPANPYPNIPDSGAEGGEGSGDFSGDTISEPSLPSKSAMGSGLVQLYNPTVSELRSFGQWLWNANGFDLNDLKRVFNDPMDMIIGLSIFPVTPIVSDTPDTIKLGNIDSEVSSNVLSSQFKRIDLGTINLEEVYGSYLDYAPYTKVQIFLPFIGIRDLDCDDVMGKAIHLTYSIDMLSGACVAHVLVNGSTMYEYGGSCNEQVPLTARDLTTIFSGIASVVATGAGAVAAISAGIAALPASASAGAVIGTAGVGVTGAGASIARNVISSKPSVEHGSGIGGTTGYLSCKKPFLIVQRPRLCHPENQEHFTGYPGFIYVSSLSQLTGFTKMVNVELTRIHATDAELEEIAEWLMSKGVRI